jgi:hypothetical protein
MSLTFALGLPILLCLADLIELPYVLMLLHKVCGRAPCPLASIQEEPTLCIPGPSTSAFTAVPRNANEALSRAAKRFFAKTCIAKSINLDGRFHWHTILNGLRVDFAR